jgi:glycosyltransferase involved in cell wall biosynthesis
MLRRALDSIKAQHYPNLEVVVVNDGGADPAPVLDDFRSEFAIRLVTHVESAGRARSAQVGLENATGAFVNFLDDDDALHPHHLRTLVEEAMRTSARVVYSNVECLLVERAEDGAERVLARSVYASEFDRTRLLFENTIPIMAVLMDRALAVEAGGFDSTFDYFEDWDLWLRLSRRTPFWHVPVVTATYFIQKIPGPRPRVEDDPRWRYLGRLFDKHRDEIRGEEWASFYLRYVEAAKARLSETEANEASRESLLSDTSATLREFQRHRARSGFGRVRRWLRWR